jgi:hypothetical protein
MTHEDDIRRARREGEAKGTTDTIERLREFTGVLGCKPVLDQPEHLAYIAYERELTARLDKVNAAVERLDSRQVSLSEELDEARIALAEEIDARREERADSNLFVKAKSKLMDLPLREKKRVTDLEAELNFVIEHQPEAVSETYIYQEELGRVRLWIEELFVAVQAAQAERDARAERLRRDLEEASRDVSRRWCTVYPLRDFVVEDPRRLAFGSVEDDRPVVAGMDFGSRWRRDQEDVANDRWSLHWIEDTNETILELISTSRPTEIWLLGKAITSYDRAQEVLGSVEPAMLERNSVALVLDAYDAAR